jgi:hypothetical protein
MKDLKGYHKEHKTDLIRDFYDAPTADEQPSWPDHWVRSGHFLHVIRGNPLEGLKVRNTLEGGKGIVGARVRDGLDAFISGVHTELG